MKKLFGNDLIEFYTSEDLYGGIPEPVEAAKCVPDWFKKLKPYSKNHRDREGFPGATAKRCMPLLDAMTHGYIIPLQGDVHVISNYDLSVIQANERNKDAMFLIDSHPNFQVDSVAWPIQKQHPIKFLNKWRVKTKPGWSCLFTAPLNHIGLPFTILSGVVDTDKYHREVNFPAIWHVPNYDDTLKAGMPLAQIIPFKREKLPKVKPRIQNKKERQHEEKLRVAMDSRLGAYTEELREKR